MPWMPVPRPFAVHAAVRVLPLPVSATALQPEMAVPPSVKLTVPEGLLPVTVAVKVTLAPTIDGLSELATVVALGTLFTVCISAVLVEPLLLASPPYDAVMLWLPTARPPVVQAAVRESPEPLNATAEHPAIDVPPSRKLTLPVGAVPLIVAVSVTLAPKTDGLAELDSVVLLVTLFTVCVSAALVELLLPPSPL